MCSKEDTLVAMIIMAIVQLLLPFSLKGQGSTESPTPKEGRVTRFALGESLAFEQVTIQTGKGIITHRHYGAFVRRMSVIKEAIDGHIFAFFLAEGAHTVVIRRYDTLRGIVFDPPRWWVEMSPADQLDRLRKGNLPKKLSGAVEKYALGWWKSLSETEQLHRLNSGDFTFPMEELKNREFAVRPTLVLPTNKGAVAVWLFDKPDDGDFVVRESLDGFTKFKFQNKVNGGMSSKLFKRPSALFVRSYFRYWGEIRPESAEPKHGAIRVGFRPSRGIAHDGVLYISQYLHFLMIEDLLERARVCTNPLRQEKLFAIAERAEKTFTWSSTRFMTEWGLFKGDAVVCDAPLPNGVDVLVFDDNLKREIFLPVKGQFIMTATPKKQIKSVRTNRQVLSMLGSWLYGGSFQPVLDEFDRRLNKVAAELKAGEYLPPVQSNGDSAVSSFEDKARAWVTAGLPLRYSRYLTGMLAGAKVRQLSPPDELADKKRRLPVPNGIASSMHTPQTYELVYGVKCPVKPGHVLLDQRLGWVPAYDIVDEFFAIAGGADSDDSIAGFLGFSDADDMFFRIQEGQMIAGFQRDPMTAEKDTDDRIGIEYQIRPIQGLKVSTRSDGSRAIIMPDGRAITTILRVSNRPLSVAELGERDNSFAPTPLPMPDEVTYEWLIGRVELNSRDPLGRYMNILMAYMSMGWTFDQVAAGEDVVDACQQLRNPADFVKLESIIDELRDNFTGRVVAEGNPVDLYILKSAGCFRYIQRKFPHLVGKGMYTELVDAHKAAVDRFEETTGILYDTITEKMMSWYSDPEPLSMTLGKSKHSARNVEPGMWLFRTISKHASNFERANGIDLNGKYINQATREMFGDWLADQLLNELSKSELLRLTKSMYLWAHRQDTNGEGDARYPERFLYWGTMFILLLEALGGTPPEISDRPVQPGPRVDSGPLEFVPTMDEHDFDEEYEEETPDYDWDEES